MPGSVALRKRRLGIGRKSTQSLLSTVFKNVQIIRFGAGRQTSRPAFSHFESAHSQEMCPHISPRIHPSGHAKNTCPGPLESRQSKLPDNHSLTHTRTCAFLFSNLNNTVNVLPCQPEIVSASIRYLVCCQIYRKLLRAQKVLESRRVKQSSLLSLGGQEDICRSVDYLIAPHSQTTNREIPYLPIFAFPSVTFLFAENE